MSLVARGSIVSALRPGVNAWWGLEYKDYYGEFQEIFDTEKSMMNYERDVQMSGLGSGVVKPEGAATEMDSMQQGFNYNYLHLAYSLGFILTHEAIQDNLYMKLAKQGTRELARSMKNAKEVTAANILNRAFNSSYTFADGVELVSTANLLTAGGTFSNRASTDADLSEAALEQGIIDIGGLVNDRSLAVQVMAEKLIVPRQLEFEAQRILKSELKYDTAENAVNVLRAGRYLPKGHCVNHFLTSSSAWFIKTDCPNGMKHFEREPLRISTELDFLTDNVQVKAYERYSFGCTDKRSIYGSQGDGS